MAATASSSRSTPITSLGMSHESILGEFRRILDQHTRTATCGRQYVLVEKLQHWLRSRIDGNVTHVERLAHVAYKDTQFLPIETHIFNPGDNCCLLVFCILQLIGCGNAIDAFYEHQKTDRLLPMRRDTIQEAFESANIPDRTKTSEFFKLQHHFKPARFCWHMKNNWDNNRVIPICEKNFLKKGGTAQIYQIAIPEEYVDETLRRVCAGYRFNAASEESPDWVRCRPTPSTLASCMSFYSTIGRCSHVLTCCYCLPAIPVCPENVHTLQ